MHLTAFTDLFFMFHTYNVIFCVIFAHLLPKNFITIVLTAQENQHLEYLLRTSVNNKMLIGSRKTSKLYCALIVCKIKDLIYVGFLLKLSWYEAVSE